ncbi:hypothetical protein SAMD00019534_123590 [Acytostelium subglobosum LB1]|uniref:hypothetical protein n=1 Tax=Acytostelium subglobosum LB1 TaxID=1410327 RepID=UPI000645050B|nr:hypothetical protein SAMD00019534_123590 [Acytostelium subglobosum LB1]GAM29183.1 hypothetical protein SAMD00019534_123590 [Acytostelium subglobosum LB1]|eukprot:XP_012747874.1 hypothetical protein SAMD00019534_123590 [Acytostelium subglobosum LB1]
MVTLSEDDFNSLSLQVKIPSSSLKTSLQTRHGINNLYLHVLKQILKHIRDRYDTNVSITGNKDVIVERLAKLVISSSTSSSSVAGLSYHVPRTRVQTPRYGTPVTAITRKRTSSGSSNGSSSSSVSSLYPLPRSSILKSIAKLTAKKTAAPSPVQGIEWKTFTDNQSILFQHVKAIGEYKIWKGSIGTEAEFKIDDEVFPKLRTTKEQQQQIDDELFIHVRLVNQRSTVLPYTSDMHLTINGNQVDFPHNVRKPSGCKAPLILFKPMDITTYVNKGRNTLSWKSSVKHQGYMVVQVVKSIPMDQLVEQAKSRETNSQTTALLQPKNADQDIEELSYDISARCPLAIMKISHPAKTSNCKHLQCFDLNYFIRFSFQQQIWNCPVCQCQAPPISLVFDSFTNNILKQIPVDCYNITLQPDGSWKTSSSEHQSISVEAKASSGSVEIDLDAYSPIDCNYMDDAFDVDADDDDADDVERADADADADADVDIVEDQPMTGSDPINEDMAVGCDSYDDDDDYYRTTFNNNDNMAATSSDSNEIINDDDYNEPIAIQDDINNYNLDNNDPYDDDDDIMNGPIDQDDPPPRASWAKPYIPSTPSTPISNGNGTRSTTTTPQQPPAQQPAQRSTPLQQTQSQSSSTTTNGTPLRSSSSTFGTPTTSTSWMDVDSFIEISDDDT